MTAWTSLTWLVKCLLVQTAWQPLWYPLTLWKMEKPIFKWQVCQTKLFNFLTLGVTWESSTCNNIDCFFLFSLFNAICFGCKSPWLPSHIYTRKQCYFFFCYYSLSRVHINRTWTCSCNNHFCLFDLTYGNKQKRRLGMIRKGFQ